jgi:hypothetical protein
MLLPSSLLATGAPADAVAQQHSALAHHVAREVRHKLSPQRRRIGNRWFSRVAKAEQVGAVHHIVLLGQRLREAPEVARVGAEAVHNHDGRLLCGAGRSADALVRHAVASPRPRLALHNSRLGRSHDARPAASALRRCAAQRWLRPCR